MPDQEVIDKRAHEYKVYDDLFRLAHRDQSEFDLTDNQMIGILGTLLLHYQENSIVDIEMPELEDENEEGGLEIP